MVNDQSLEDRIYEYIDRHIGTTFAELARVFPEGFNGEYEFGIFEQNVLFWSGLTKEMADTLLRMIIEQRIAIDSTPMIVEMYMFDGAYLPLPLFKGRKTKKLVWLPIAFYTMSYYQKVLLPSKKKKDKQLLQKMIDDHKGIKYDEWVKEHGGRGGVVERIE
jgi:hypothetical protein